MKSVKGTKTESKSEDEFSGKSDAELKAMMNGK